jgi:hypothetical protein
MKQGTDSTVALSAAAWRRLQAEARRQHRAPITIVERALRRRFRPHETLGARRRRDA